MSNQHSEAHEVVLLDVDNTLINNDKVKTDVENQMRELLGETGAARFWEVYEVVRKEMDGVDIPATLLRIEPEFSDKAQYKRLYRLWMDFPYAEYIFPGVFQVLSHLKTFALPVILSDGDASFQLRKIVKSGICKAVDGNVLIYQHKDRHFEDITSTFPAQHYVMVEDKATLLAKGKAYFEEKLTTVWVKQGHYADQPSEYQPDLVLKAIADLQKYDDAKLIKA